MATYYIKFLVNCDQYHVSIYNYIVNITLCSFWAIIIQRKWQGKQNFKRTAMQTKKALINDRLLGSKVP